MNVNSEDRPLLYSFSQGAAVCGSALTVYGLSVDNYVMSRAALPAGAYDVSDAVNSYQDFLDAEVSNPTPDYIYDLGYRGYLSNVSMNVSGTFIRFFNKEDFALKTGNLGPLATNWEANQIGYKPNKINVVKAYSYASWLVDDPITTGSRCFLRRTFPFAERAVLDIHESMSFVARPRSEAAGARFDPIGTMDEYDVGPHSPCNFGKSEDDHGAQWNRRIQQLWPYFEKILEALTEE